MTTIRETLRSIDPKFDELEREQASRTLKVVLAEDGLFNFRTERVDLESEIEDGLYIDAQVTRSGLHIFRIFDFNEGVGISGEVASMGRITSDDNEFRVKLFDLIVNWF